MVRKQIVSAVVLLSVVACGESEAGSSPASLPAGPEAFRIELSGTACFGSCPTYSVAIDEAGNVNFVGETCVARPGVFEQKVPAKDARAIYDALMATQFASLGDRYTEEEDGCDLFTDSPTYSWNVVADGSEKALVRYAGCEGVDGLDEVDAIMSTFHQHADVLRLLRPAPFNCDTGDGAVFPVHLRLSQAGTPVATLKIESKNDWSGQFELADCTGVTEARGSVQVESRRWVLLDEDKVPMELRNGLGTVGSLVIDLAPPAHFGDQATIRGARAMRLDDELSFDVAIADGCGA